MSVAAEPFCRNLGAEGAWEPRPVLRDTEGRAIERDAWDALLLDAATPNLFHGRRVVEAHLAHGLARSDLRFLACRDSGGDLAAFLPFRDGGVPLARGGLVFASPYARESTPLLAGRDPAGAAERLLAAMAKARPGAVWRFPSLALGSAAGEALLAAAGASGRAVEFASRFERPVLDRSGSYAEYVAAHLSRNRRRGLARAERRLRELGDLRHETVTGGKDLVRAVENFLALEAAGWKGRRRTAYASRPATAAFARELYREGSDASLVRADSLTLDGRTIAVSLSLIAGGICRLHKTAFDETLRAFAPGVVLEHAILRDFLDEGFADRLDSLATAGDLLGELFVGREAIGDLFLAGDPSVPRARVRRAAAFQRTRDAAIGAMKGWIRPARA